MNAVGACEPAESGSGSRSKDRTREVHKGSPGPAPRPPHRLSCSATARRGPELQLINYSGSRCNEDTH